MNNYLLELAGELEQAESQIKNLFQFQEIQNPLRKFSCGFSTWQKGLEKLQNNTLKKSLQEEMQLPWEFMDRVYGLAAQSIQDNRHEDGQRLFLFLAFLNPEVLEYWLGLGLCQQEMKKFEAAIATYMTCLSLRAKVDIILYQLATCFFTIDAIDLGKQCLDLCIKYCKQKESQDGLLEKSLQTKQIIEGK
jgi:tetratricopeptide (TPR) repeat protein